MKKLTPQVVFIIVLDLLLLSICVSHIPSVAHRARIPFDVREEGDLVIVSKILDPAAAQNLDVEDRITTWNAHPIRLSEYLEFAADLDSIGTQVTIGYERDSKSYGTAVWLVPFYSSARFSIVTAFVGFAFWLIGLFVLLNRPNDSVAGVLHWSILLMSATVFLTQGSMAPANTFSLFRRALLLLVYPLASAAFLYFTTLFPKPKLGPKLIKGGAILGSAVLIAAILIVLFWRAVESSGTEAFYQFQQFYDVFHAFLLVYGIGTIGSVFYSYLTAESTEDRRKIQWIVWGFTIGVTPFLLLIVVPQLLLSVDFVPEEYATVFLVAVPFSLAISFLKYRILDIGVVISRSIVYFVLSVFVGAVYVVLGVLLTSAVGGTRISDEYLWVVALSLIVAVFLNPLRNLVQRFVDNLLFPVSAQYRKSVKELTAEFHKVLSVDQLSKAITAVAKRMLPVSAVGLYSYSRGFLTLRDAQGSDLDEHFFLSAKHAKEIAQPVVYATPSSISARRHDIDISKEVLLKRLGISVCVPLFTESGEVLGILVANPRHEARRFDEGEVDLLATIARQAGESMERLQLQEKIILEREGKKQAEELNKLKSFFVSSVSHELRTPLTSIRMFADMLREGKVAGLKRRDEYFDIIVGETDRLARLINNILDFSKIERGLKEYNFTDLDLREVVKRSVAAMQYQIKMEGGTIRVKIPKRLPPITGDVDALEEVVLNLVSNALKYSLSKKDISLSVKKEAKHVMIVVTDKGMGIPETALLQVFDQFFRVKDDRSRQVGGAGLGLAVVKHIVEAHNGSISVTSKVGAGSTFSVRLPLKGQR
jgi:signal transduction histidine kinase